MSQTRCPQCGQNFEFELSEARPFCSARCQLIDLGQWLDEKQGLPYERLDDPDDEGEAGLI